MVDISTEPETTDVLPGPTTPETSTHRWERWQVIAAVVLIAGVALPTLLTGFGALGRHWLPAGDWAAIELRTRDVGTLATPLIGPYSRFGWNHPGPLLFWVLAIPYRLSGSSSSSLLFAAAAINAGAIAGTGFFAWRRGRLPLVAITCAGLAILTVHMGPSPLRDPWNASITVVPLALFVISAWSAFEGDRLALPVLALVGTFLAQSHVGFALLVGVLSVVAVVRFVRVANWRRPVALSLIILAICWLPVAIDQLVGAGNAADLVRYFATTGRPTTGISDAVGVVARELGGIAPWLGAREPVSPLDGHLLGAGMASLVLPIVAFAAAVVLARWRGAMSAVRLQIITGTAAVVGLGSVSRITPPVFDYLVRWWWVLAMVWWVSIAWSIWSALFESPDATPTRWARWATPVLTLCAAVTLVWSGRLVVSGIDHIGTPDGGWWVPLEGIVPDTIANAPRPGPVLVRTYGSDDGSVGDGVRLELERAGVPVLVDDELVHSYGESRRSSTHTASAVLWVVTGPSADEMAREPGLRKIASWDPLPGPQRWAQISRMAALGNQLEAAGRPDLVHAMRSGGSLDQARGLDGVDQELLDEVEQARRRGDQVAVFVEEQPWGSGN